jgi:hypothetical protein
MVDAPSWSPSWPSPLPPPLLATGAALYLSGEDGLQATILNAASGVTVRVSGRFLGLGAMRVQPFNTAFVPPTNRTAGSFSIPLGEGWLLDAMLSVSGGTPQHGQTWARLALVRGGPTSGLEVGQVAHGYVTAHKFLRWPAGVAEAPLDGPGALRSISGTQPGAGALISETVPTGARWQLLAFRFTLVTNATVATRVVSGVVDDGTNILAAHSAQQDQTASQTISYTIGPGLGSGYLNSDNDFAIQVPSTLVLAAGYRIRTTCANIQAGDQFSAPQYLVREWIEGQS